MKKTVSSAILCILFLFAFQAHAQVKFQEYNWKDFKVSFSIPTTHKIEANSDTEFESGDNLTWLQMYPYKDETETAKGMIEKVAKEAGVKIHDQGEYQVGGYDAYWITCESAKEPEWEYWYIGLIDPKTDVNFYAIIWYKKNNDAAGKIAEAMSLKFKKM